MRVSAMVQVEESFVRKRRKELGLTLKQASLICLYSAKHIGNIERRKGKYSTIAIELILKAYDEYEKAMNKFT